jgi:hypothetical protein
VSASKNQLSERDKARRWDELIACLREPGLRDAHIHSLSGVRRAVYLLLADQEALPPALVAELKAYRVKVDALCTWKPPTDSPPSRACSTSSRPT